MTRAVYSLLWWLALPALPLRLWWRGRKERGYRERIGERFGRYAVDVARPAGRVLWIHAVSLGETRAALPLIERAERARPDLRILLTHMTATGREAGRALYGTRVTQAWLPYDVPFAVRRFIAHFKPDAGVLMETELWPNIAAQCARRGIPLFLVNARLSPRSASRYERVAALARTMLASLAGISAQTRDDAKRLSALGAHDVAVAGNLKFDIDVPAALTEWGGRLRQRIGAARAVWIAASTRDGEEALLLDALAAHPNALPPATVTIIVPRHPQRFDAVADLLKTRGIAFVRRSADVAVPPDVSVVLGDSLGELPGYYAAADVAFVGGSLLPLGGQNLIEAIAVGVPTLVGPHTFNFAEASARAIEAGAAIRVPDAKTLVATAGELLRNAGDRAAMRARARAFHDAHRGAADRLWAWLAPRLP